MYKLGVIYGFDKLNEIIDRCLIIPDENREKKLERCIKQVGNKNEVKE